MVKPTLIQKLGEIRGQGERSLRGGEGRGEGWFQEK
jgi:hypothetical protein